MLRTDTQSEWKGPFFFIQAADTQFGMIEGYLEKKPDPKWDKEIVLTRQAIAAVNRMNPKPRFFVVCGDLVDAMPGTTTYRANRWRDRAVLRSPLGRQCGTGRLPVGMVAAPSFATQSHSCPHPRAQSGAGDEREAWTGLAIAWLPLHYQLRGERGIV